jgi:hypothetical protein
MNADTVHSLNLSTDFKYLHTHCHCALSHPTARRTHIVGSLYITSSITSRPAFAIICITCRSCPPPIRTAPPLVCCVALDAPESAVSVPANADVDHVGKFDARGDVTLGTGFVDWCVRLYSGVSDGDNTKRWCDIFQKQALHGASEAG